MEMEETCGEGMSQPVFYFMSIHSKLISDHGISQLALSVTLGGWRVENEGSRYDGTSPFRDVGVYC